MGAVLSGYCCALVLCFVYTSTSRRPTSTLTSANCHSTCYVYACILIPEPSWVSPLCGRQAHALIVTMEGFCSICIALSQPPNHSKLLFKQAMALAHRTGYFSSTLNVIHWKQIHAVLEDFCARVYGSMTWHRRAVVRSIYKHTITASQLTYFLACVLAMVHLRRIHMHAR